VNTLHKGDNKYTTTTITTTTTTNSNNNVMDSRDTHRQRSYSKLATYNN